MVPSAPIEPEGITKQVHSKGSKGHWWLSTAGLDGCLNIKNCYYIVAWVQWQRFGINFGFKNWVLKKQKEGGEKGIGGEGVEGK